SRTTLTIHTSASTPGRPSVSRPRPITWRIGMSEQATEQGTDDGFMTVDELAALLRVNRKTVYAAIEAGEIPGVKRLGRVIRLYRRTVLEWAVKEDRPKRRERLNVRIQAQER